MDELIRAQESAEFHGLSEKWRERFAFFKVHGDPHSKEAQQAFRRLPPRMRRRIAWNWWAFWMAPIYLCVLGLWRKAIVLWGGLIAADIFLDAAGMDTTGLVRAINLGCGIYFMLTVNYAYYLRKIHGVRGWNPFSPY